MYGGVLLSVDGDREGNPENYSGRDGLRPTAELYVLHKPTGYLPAASKIRAPPSSVIAPRITAPHVCMAAGAPPATDPEKAFPESWNAILERNVAHWKFLDDAERVQPRSLIELLAWNDASVGSMGDRTLVHGTELVVEGIGQ